MSSDGRRAATLALALLFAAPSPGEGETLGDAYTSYAAARKRLVCVMVHEVM